MADPVVTETHPLNPNSNPSNDFDSLPIPPLDPLFFSDNINTTVPETYMSDLGFDDDGFDFTLDDLYLPSETEDFLAGDFLSDDFLAGYDGSEAKDPSSEVAVQVSGDRSSDLARVTNSPALSQVSVDRGSDAARASNLPESSGDHSSSSARILNSTSPEYGCGNREFSGPASSQGSGNCGSGSETMNSSSPDSDNCDRDVSSNLVVDQKIKLEEIGKNCLTKRKKEHEDVVNTESRSSKFRRSSMAIDSGLSVGNDEEDKRKARLMRNRESAQLSRQRKKHYVEELEDKVRSMHSTIADLNGKISFIMAENGRLRQQLSGGGGVGMCPPPPPPGMYPHPSMAHMAYPWMPCAPYVVKPQGSQVPLVPIPRLKPQQPVSASKPKKESKKAEGKTKKVASVSFLGLLFFILLFGGLVPMVNVKYGGIGEKVTGGSDYISYRFGSQHRGRILTVNGHLNGSDHSMGAGLLNEKFDFGGGIHCERGRIGGGEELEVENKEQRSQPLPGSHEFVPSKNYSEPLVASLYVPRNDKLVKIDGNLIIHSVMASEKAMASRLSSRTKSSDETGLAIAGNLAPALAFSEVGRSKQRHSHLYRQRALASGSADAFKDNMKSTAADGKLHQWFREGLAGPMLGSGMCTEVFQFDVSSASVPGAIVPASPVSNNSSKQQQNSTRLNKGRNRRILHGLPLPLTGSTLNITEEHVGRNSQKDNFQGNKSVSSMVVSVLVDPREAGDGDGDGMIGPKSISRIFVVVLLDSVKYVTYSCVLPLKGSGHHLVTT